MFYQRKEMILDSITIDHGKFKTTVDLVAWKSSLVNNDTIYSIVYHFEPEKLIYDYTDLSAALEKLKEESAS